MEGRGKWKGGLSESHLRKPGHSTAAFRVVSTGLWWQTEVSFPFGVLFKEGPFEAVVAKFSTSAPL